VLTAGTKAWAEAIKAKKRAKIFFIILAELSSSRGVCPTQDDERVENNDKTLRTNHNRMYVAATALRAPPAPLLFTEYRTQVQDTLSGTETPIA
jgi:hypothetical protein